jgi:hypothetical protein
MSAGEETGHCRVAEKLNPLKPEKPFGAMTLAPKGAFFDLCFNGEGS